MNSHDPLTLEKGSLKTSDLHLEKPKNVAQMSNIRLSYNKSTEKFGVLPPKVPQYQVGKVATHALRHRMEGLISERPAAGSANLMSPQLAGETNTLGANKRIAADMISK